MADYGVGPGLAAGVEMGLKMGDTAFAEQQALRRTAMEERSRSLQEAMGMEELKKLKAGNAMVDPDKLSSLLPDPYGRKIALQMVAPFRDPNTGMVRTEDLKGVWAKLNDPAHWEQVSMAQLDMMKRDKADLEGKIARPSPADVELGKDQEYKSQLANLDAMIKQKESNLPHLMTAKAQLEKATRPVLPGTKTDQLVRAALTQKLGREPTDAEWQAEVEASKGRITEQGIKLREDSKKRMEQLTPEQSKGLDNITKDISELRIDPEKAFSMFMQRMGGGANSGALRLELENRIKTKYPDFDFTKATTYANASKDKTFIRAEENVKSVLDSAKMVKELIPALKTGDVKVINRVNLWWQEHFGNPAPTNWKVAAVAMSQEFNRAYSDSVVNPEGRFNKELGNLDGANSPEQLMQALDTNIRLTKIRGEAIGRMRHPYTKEEITGSPAAEGATGGGTGPILNNPLNMKLGGATQKYVDSGVATKGRAAKDGGNFLNFTSRDEGLKAAQDLLFGPNYNTLTVDAAMKKWSNSGYGGDIVPSIKTKKIGDLSREEKVTLVAAMIKREGNGGGVKAPMQVGRFTVEEG